jgi:AcrR family transcriptional regulator
VLLDSRNTSLVTPSGRTLGGAGHNRRAIGSGPDWKSELYMTGISLLLLQGRAMSLASIEPGSGRSLRRDAEQNRQRILRAAAEVFNAYGLQATLDDVARHAGVGVGTVYRRFPNKEALWRAPFAERIDTLLALTDDALAEPDSWAGLISFLEQAADLLAADRGLRQMLMFRAYGQEQAVHARNRMQRQVTKILRRAQRDGAVRGDIFTSDILFIEYMIAMVGEYAQDVRPEVWRRYLTLIADGLRPNRVCSTTMSEPPLSSDEVEEVMHSRPVPDHKGPLRRAIPADDD